MSTPVLEDALRSKPMTGASAEDLGGHSPNVRASVDASSGVSKRPTPLESNWLEEAVFNEIVDELLADESVDETTDVPPSASSETSADLDDPTGEIALPSPRPATVRVRTELTPLAPEETTRSTVALATSIGASSALSFAVHALATRQLSAADYGGLAAVLAILTAAAVPVGAVQTAITRSAADLAANGQLPSGRRILRSGLPFAGAITAVGALVASPVARSLRLGSVWPIVLGGLWIAAVLLGTVAKALLIARGAHTPVAHSIFHGSALRLGAAAALTPWFGISGGIAAAVLGDLVSSAIYGFGAQRRGLFHDGPAQVRAEWPDAGRALSSQLSLWLFASLPLIVGRRVLPEAVSGSFATMATAALACLFLPQALATIAFPRFVADGSKLVLAKATAVAAAVGALCAAMLCARPALLFVVFFGPGYAPSTRVLALLCAFFVLLGCLSVLTQYVVARRQGGSLPVWFALAGATTASLFVGSSSVRVATAMLVPALVATMIVMARAMRSNPGADAGNPSESVDDNAELAAWENVRAASQLHGPASLDISVVIPSYNGRDVIRPCVERVQKALQSTGRSYEIVVAIDGSTDGSEQSLGGLGSNVIVDDSRINRGKGSALRRGFARARGDVVCFIDGDGDIDPAVLLSLVERVESSGADYGVASKNHPGSAVSATAMRRTMSAGYRFVAHWMFSLEVSDTQCGCKAFRRDFLAATLGRTREDGFAFDLELLTIGERLGRSHGVEVPVLLARTEVGTVSSSTAMQVFRDTVRIYRRFPPARFGPLPLAAPAPVGADFNAAAVALP